MSCNWERVVVAMPYRRSRHLRSKERTEEQQGTHLEFFDTFLQPLNLALELCDPVACLIEVTPELIRVCLIT